MSKKTSNKGPGRPIEYRLNGHQRNSILTRLGRGERMSDIANRLGVNYFAVLRVKRSLS